MTEAASTARTLLSGLVKAALMSDDRASLLWREEAARGLAALRAAPEAARALRLDGLWTLAVQDAEAPEFREEEGRVSFGLPAACPFGVEELLDEGFGLDEAVERVRKSAATG
ncbi:MULTISPECIES: hypothetical protein [Methylobacterium]|uniref:Uncharacterized protein n=1 Tax=Methylobacterium jeotgali TaxID=381630 RepID=A0ABQ4SRV8_9HYPH|nr:MULTISPECIES: hypothetical protein [Methylobacterium]PIU08721.1 MAG: hypothetical protein COT56_00460 [Methylobacterium sp. CG09_land_8_20_14_0_10_71_15]PIU16295.1 MAG: hypothetical protein COT28_00925 [Methylobacterium sp. CG08_land_8_20_14_0_20_71_15]GBU18283.1 hypothetical protein AwMethylo_24980 [Methylobacterium sp.]GJE05927.1 hypothetical protein AOPFMNJM_1233 [Methylobacterium jeotgali]